MATSFSTVSASYDEATSQVFVVLGLLNAGQLNSQTLSVTAYMNTSQGSASVTISRVQMQALITAYNEDSTTLNLPVIRLPGCPVVVASNDSIGVTVIEDLLGNANNLLAPASIVGGNAAFTYVSPFTGSIPVFSKPDAPVISIIAKNIAWVSPSTSTVSNLQINIPFGDSDGGNPLSAYCVFWNVRNSTGVSSYASMNNAISNIDLTNGYATFSAFTNLVGIPNDSVVSIQVFLDNNFQDSVLSNIVTVNVNQQFPAPVLTCAEQAPVSDDGITVSLNVSDSNAAAENYTYIYILTKSGTTYTQYGNSILKTNAIGLAQGGYQFSILPAASPVAFTVYQFYAAVGTTSTYSPGTPFTSKPSAVVNALSGILTPTSVVSVTSSTTATASVSGKDTYSVAVSGSSAPAAVSPQCMLVSLFKNGTQVAQKISNVVVGGSYPSTDFVLSRSSINETIDIFTASAIFLTQLSATQLLYISNNFSYQGNNFYQYGDAGPSVAIKPQPVSTAILPQIGNLSLASVNAGGVNSLGASWTMSGINQNTYPLVNIQFQLATNPQFSSPITLLSQQSGVSPSTSMLIPWQQEYFLLQQAGGLAAQTWYYVQARTVGSWAGSATGPSDINGEWVQTQFCTPAALPISSGPSISVSTTGGVLNIATVQPAQTLPYGPFIAPVAPNAAAATQQIYSMLNIVYNLYSQYGQLVGTQTVAYNPSVLVGLSLPIVSFPISTSSGLSQDQNYSVRSYINYQNGSSIVASSLSVTAEVFVPSTPTIGSIQTIQTATTLQVIATVSDNAINVYALVPGTPSVLQSMTYSATTKLWSSVVFTIPANPVLDGTQVSGYVLASSNTGTAMAEFP